MNGEKILMIYVVYQLFSKMYLHWENYESDKNIFTLDMKGKYPRDFYIYSQN